VVGWSEWPLRAAKRSFVAPNLDVAEAPITVIRRTAIGRLKLKMQEESDPTIRRRGKEGLQRVDFPD
jgi:hypothetical protein